MEEYRTCDYWLTASLIAKGKTIERMEGEGKRVYFVFSNYDECKELEKGYWDYSLKVSAKKMADAQRELKDRMFNR